MNKPKQYIIVKYPIDTFPEFGADCIDINRPDEMMTNVVALLHTFGLTSRQTLASLTWTAHIDKAHLMNLEDALEAQRVLRHLFDDEQKVGFGVLQVDYRPRAVDLTTYDIWKANEILEKKKLDEKRQAIIDLVFASGIENSGYIQYLNDLFELEDAFPKPMPVGDIKLPIAGMRHED